MTGVNWKVLLGNNSDTIKTIDELNEEYAEIYKIRLGEAKRGYNLTQGIFEE